MTLLTPPPPAPNRSDPATFPDRADAYVAWWATVAAEINGGALGVFTTGTPAAPSIRPDGDTNTGLNFLGGDQLQLVTNAIARVLLNTSEMQINLPVTGTAVVSSASDVTAGRLLKTEAGPAQAFRRGNVLGTVSHSGGVPTGALLERGGNANGTYLRFAANVQICWRALSTDSSGIGAWTFPIAFSAQPFVLGTATAASDDRNVTTNTPSTTGVDFRGWTTIGNTWEGALRGIAIGNWQ